MNLVILFWLFFISESALSSCFPVLDDYHPCRFPKGDSWCTKKGLTPYAYHDKCLRDVPPPQHKFNNTIMSVIKSVTKRVTIHNMSSSDVLWTYITPSGQPNWGGDQLGSVKIPSGGSYKWTINWEGCLVDVKAKTASGEASQLGVNACDDFVWTLYDE